MRQREGQKGIAIIAPLLYKKETAPVDTDKSDLAALIGFRVVYVFDISQTNGDELPEPSHVKGDPAQYIPKLDALIDGRGILLEYADTLRPEGASHGGKIVIRSGLSPARDFAVKVHELAHEILHHSAERFSKVEVETEAEAVAFVVCSSIGLDANTAFSDYIQMHQGDSKTLMGSLQRIRETSGVILEGLG